MYISLFGLAGAALLFAAGIVQWFVLKAVFERSRATQAAGWSRAEREKREAEHGLILRIFLGIDCVVLPAVGYYAGTLIFDT